MQVGNVLKKMILVSMLLTTTVTAKDIGIPGSGNLEELDKYYIYAAYPMYHPTVESYLIEFAYDGQDYVAAFSENSVIDHLNPIWKITNIEILPKLKKGEKYIFYGCSSIDKKIDSNVYAVVVSEDEIDKASISAIRVLRAYHREAKIEEYPPDNIYCDGKKNNYKIH